MRDKINEKEQEHMWRNKNKNKNENKNQGFKINIFFCWQEKLAHTETLINLHRRAEVVGAIGRSDSRPRGDFTQQE